MDHFGIGAAVKGAVEIMFRSARRTGRTTRFIASLKDGDRVLVASEQEKRLLEHQLLERGLHVHVSWRDPRKFHYEPEPRNPHGRTLLDHNFVEQCYRLAIAEEEGRLRRWYEVHNAEPLKGQAAEYVAQERSKWE